MKYDIIATTWWTPPNPYPLIRGLAPGLCIGAVAIKTHDGKWKAYLGFGMGGDSLDDAETIARSGVKVSRAEAAGMFPELNIEDFVF